MMVSNPLFGGQGFGNWLNSNGDMLLQSGIGLLSGATPQEQVAGAALGVANVRKQNKTMDFLRKIDPTLSQAVDSGAISPGDAYKLYAQQKLEAQKPKNNYMAVGKALYDTSNGQWITPPAGVGGAEAEYGLAPVYGTDAQGRTVLGQLSKDGTFRLTQLPEGFSPTPGISNIDTGTGTRTINNRTGALISETPKDIAGAASQKEIGQAAGAAEASAPGDLQAAVNAKALVTDIRNDPYLGWGTGFSSYGNSIRGTGGHDFQNKVDQAKSGAFLTAIQQMRGLGALSNAEGDAATRAVTRLNTSTSEEEFVSALNDYERIIDQAMARAQGRMGERTLKGPQPAAGQNYKSRYGLE
jgi:hypothetical protein